MFTFHHHLVSGRSKLESFKRIVYGSPLKLNTISLISIITLKPFYLMVIEINKNKKETVIAKIYLKTVVPADVGNETQHGVIPMKCTTVNTYRQRSP